MAVGWSAKRETDDHPYIGRSTMPREKHDALVLGKQFRKWFATSKGSAYPQVFY
jgi:hypothetical protein